MRKSFFKPSVESLSERVVPVVFYWTPPGVNEHWSNPANWTPSVRVPPGSIPGANDTASFVGSNKDCILDIHPTVDSLDLKGTGTLYMNGKTLSVTNGTLVFETGKVETNGGSMALNNAVAIVGNGGFGTFSGVVKNNGLGAWNLQNGSTLNFSGTVAVNFETEIVIGSNSTVKITNSNNVDLKATGLINIGTTGHLQLLSDGDILTTGTNDFSISNSGTITSSGSGVEVYLPIINSTDGKLFVKGSLKVRDDNNTDYDIENSGLVVLEMLGSLNVSDSTGYRQNSGVTALCPSAIAGGGTFEVEGSMQFSGGKLKMNSNGDDTVPTNDDGRMTLNVLGIVRFQYGTEVCINTYFDTNDPNNDPIHPYVHTDLIKAVGFVISDNAVLRLRDTDDAFPTGGLAILLECTDIQGITGTFDTVYNSWTANNALALTLFVLPDAFTNNDELIGTL